MEPWLELNNKVVMVTGASSGLGREFCLDLAKAGCRIIAAARRVDRLQSLCEEINNRLGSAESSEPRAVAVELDVSASAAAIEAAAEKAWDAFGRIDVLINNAGVRGSVHTPLNLSEDEWDSVTKTNLKGTWLVSKYVCARMRDAQRGGSVINISSTAGLNRSHLPGSLIYATSKAALNTMTKVMALELGAHKIRVNSISPGLFKSEITESLMQKNWFNNVAFKTIPLRTHGTTDPALTSLVRYLVHDSSEYVTGNVFIVEAGATLTEQQCRRAEVRSLPAWSCDGSFVGAGKRILLRFSQSRLQNRSRRSTTRPLTIALLQPRRVERAASRGCGRQRKRGCYRSRGGEGLGRVWENRCSDQQRRHQR